MAAVGRMLGGFANEVFFGNPIVGPLVNWYTGNKTVQQNFVDAVSVINDEVKEGVRFVSLSLKEGVEVVHQDLKGSVKVVYGDVVNGLRQVDLRLENGARIAYRDAKMGVISVHNDLKTVLSTAHDHIKQTAVCTFYAVVAGTCFVAAKILGHSGGAHSSDVFSSIANNPLGFSLNSLGVLAACKVVGAASDIKNVVSIMANTDALPRLISNVCQGVLSAYGTYICCSDPSKMNLMTGSVYVIPYLALELAKTQFRDSYEGARSTLKIDHSTQGGKKPQSFQYVDEKYNCLSGVTLKNFRDPANMSADAEKRIRADFKFVKEKYRVEKFNDALLQQIRKDRENLDCEFFNFLLSAMKESPLGSQKLMLNQYLDLFGKA